MIDLENHGIGANISTINIFCKPTEPAKKHGIWIQSPNSQSVKDVFVEKNVFLEGSWYIDDNAKFFRGSFGCVSIGTKIYFIAGLTGYSNESYNSVYIYDTVTNIWSTGVSMPTGRQEFGCVSIGTKIYCIGGMDVRAKLYNTLEIYDTTTNTWSTGASMPTGRYAFGCVTVGNKIYCIGGDINQSNENFSSKVEVYNTTTNAWSTVADIPTSRADLGCAAIGSKIYCIGGASQYKKLSKVEVYDTTTNTWRTVADMPTCRSRFGCISSTGTKIYCIGGENTTKLTKFEIYDTSTNVWSTGADIPVLLSCFGCVIIGSKLYCIGGATTGGSSTYSGLFQVLTLIGKQYQEGQTVILKQSETSGSYATKLFNTSVKTSGDFGLKTVFDNIWIYQNSKLQEYPTFVGDGTKWIKIKN